MSLVFRREAQLEFDQAAKWYERQRPGLGAEFVNEIRRVLEIISEHPSQYPFAEGDVRVAYVRRFPFSVYFRVKTDRTVIIAVFHTSRDSSIWHERS